MYVLVPPATTITIIRQDLNVPNSTWSKFVLTDGTQSYKITKPFEQAANNKKKKEEKKKKTANYREVSGQSIPKTSMEHSWTPAA